MGVASNSATCVKHRIRSKRELPRPAGVGRKAVVEVWMLDLASFRWLDLVQYRTRSQLVEPLSIEGLFAISAAFAAPRFTAFLDQKPKDR